MLYLSHDLTVSSGYLMRVPCSEVRIQICKCVISFCHTEPPKKEYEGNIYFYEYIDAYFKKCSKLVTA